VQRARALCDQDSLQAELVFLRDVLRQNGYNDWQIQRVLNRRPNTSRPDDNPDSVSFLPYIGTLFNRISRVLSRHNIKSVRLLPKKISGFLRRIKDNLGLRTPGVYRIPCECCKVYIGQTGRSVETRLKEHQRRIRLEYPDKSAVAEHSVDLGHPIQFHNTSILATETQHMDRIVREAIETELHSNNMKREVGFCLSKSWKPLIFSLKKPDAGATRPHAHSAVQTRGYWVNAHPVDLPCPPPEHVTLPALACYML
jgi:hypothetical protein